VGADGLDADAGITSAEFAAKALHVLPIEQPHDFRKVLEDWAEPLRCSPAAKPSSSEMVLSTEERESPAGYRWFI
jgi:hypothetical protein